MNIGLFTDTYFPQVSGVATSIKTLRDELIAQGNNVYIFTTTDPRADTAKEEGIYRFPSIPFISFKDRRIAFAGAFKAIRIAKRLGLDIVHNQTEFSMGVVGKIVAHELDIPCLHTYHTMYQDYLHYIANGHILKPKDVARLAHMYMKNMDGVIAPSERVLKTLESYQIESPIRVIPTGINLRVYDERDTEEEKNDLRDRLGYTPETPLLLSLSRLAFEKNIQELVEAMPDILEHDHRAQLLIVGDGPAREALERQTREIGMTGHIRFAGEIPNEVVHHYYQIANVFVSASDSESQGLTYDEALASDLPIVVRRSPYTDELIDDPAIGMSFQRRGELVKDVIHYLDHDVTPEETDKRKAKLHDISAEVFAHRVMDFYLECQDQHKIKSVTKHKIFPHLRSK